MNAPETRRAWLYCASCRRPTLHTFEGAERTIAELGAWAVRFLFGCNDCGRLRAWGCE